MSNQNITILDENGSPVVMAAQFVARELHKGQKDKGGNDYFTSHLLVVGSYGSNWKEKVVGFLHDAAEDTPYTVDEVIENVRKKLETLTASQFPSDEDWNEVKSALHTLNHHNAPSRADYIQQIKQNRLALSVKLNDLRSNMDLSRIPQPSSKDLARLQRYKTEYRELTDRLNEMIKKDSASS